MDRPHRNIRFTTTEDGAAIAFWEIGEGKPIVMIQNFNLSHAELEWEVPAIASFHMELAEQYRVIRQDPRGIGLSEDRPEGQQNPYSTHELCLDIDAVADAIGLDSFALMATNIVCPVAIEFTATRPKLVSELILCNGVAAVASSHIAAPLRAQQALFRLEAEMGGSYLNVWEPLVNEDDRVPVTRMVQDSLGRVGDTSGQWEWDSQSFLGWIEAPTLIMGARVTDGVVKDARKLAAGIKRSELCVLEGTFAPYWTDRASTVRAIYDFLQSEDLSKDPIEFGFRTVVFTDIVESTAYVRRVGDEAGRAAIRELEGQIASLATAHGGRVVKNLGDGSLVLFGSNSAAIDFALDIQEKCSDGPLDLRVGMAAGEPIHEDGDIHGSVVAHASRIGDIGDAGEVIVSDSVRQLAMGKGFAFEPRGQVTLKGFEEAERIWSVSRSRGGAG